MDRARDRRLLGWDMRIWKLEDVGVGGTNSAPARQCHTDTRLWKMSMFKEGASAELAWWMCALLYVFRSEQV